MAKQDVEETGTTGLTDPTIAPSRDGPPPRRRRWLPWLIAAAVLIVALVLYRELSSVPSRPPTPPPAAIAVATARRGDINQYIAALGTVTPVYTVTVYAQVSGQIIAVHYHQGQLVRKGAPLIDIDPRPYQSLLAQAEGALQRDQGALVEARMDLKRYQAAYARNGVSRQQVEDQQQTVVQDEGTVKADQGMVDYDRVELAYCHIVAPISGLVGLRLVDPGNTVFAGSGSTLVVITQLQPITVVFDVAEDEVPQVQAQLRAGQHLPVAAFDRTDEHQLGAGMLTALDNEVDTTTGTVKFRADFPNQDLALFPNQFVNARLLLKTLQGVTLVPNAAVQYNGTSTFVYVVKADSTVAVQTVTVLASNDEDSAVSGVNPGTLVTTSGFERIENGARVSYARPASGGTAGGTTPTTTVRGGSGSGGGGGGGGGGGTP